MPAHSKKHVIALRIFHGALTVYFTLCLAYLFIVAATGEVNSALFTVAILSLAIEGVLVFALNNGDCPLIHLQRSMGDTTPFFELLFPPRLAKQAIPLFAALTIVAILVILLRFVH
jgi:hypothetical protein